MDSEIRNSKKALWKPFFAVSGVLLACVLMLASNFLVTYLSSVLYISPFYKLLDAEWKLALLDILLYLLLLLIPSVFLLVFFRMNPFQPFRETPGVTRMPILYILMTIGIGYLVSFLVNLFFGDLFSPFEQHLTADSFYHDPLAIAIYFVELAILPAIFEEWLFRGIALKNLLPYGKWTAIIVSTLFFSFSHISPTNSLFAFACGILLGYSYVTTGSIWFGSLIHMLVNALSFFSSYWYYVYQNNSVTVAVNFLDFILMGFGIAGLIVFLSRSVRRKKDQILPPSENSIPDAKTRKYIFCNPIFYIIILGYAGLLYIYYLR